MGEYNPMHLLDRNTQAKCIRKLDAELKLQLCQIQLLWDQWRT